MSDDGIISERLGAALGNALAGYRDHEANRAAEALGEVVGLVRELENRIAALQRAREIDQWPL